MIELINKIFIYHKFDGKQIEDGILYSKTGDYNYYWFVVQIEKLVGEDVIKVQDIWFEKCKKLTFDKDFDKNASLLIVTKKDEDDFEKKNIFLIEEDPYQFKKYVLTYTDNSVIELKKQLSSNEAESLLDLVVNDKIFEDYKKSYHNYSWLNLLFNIAHKLPFLDIKITINQDLQDLFTKSKQELIVSGNFDFYELIDYNFNSEIIENLNHIDDDLLIELFNKSEDDGIKD